MDSSKNSFQGLKVGMKVKPLIGFWKGFEGEITKISESEERPFEVEFEENETNQYSKDQLELA